VSPAQVAAAAVAILLAGGVAWRRRRLGLERSLLGIGIAVGLGVYASGLLSKIPNPEEAIKEIAQALGAWTYAFVGTAAFLETGAFVGLVAPGETIVIVGGVIAGEGEISILPLIGLVWLCAALGDSTSFMLGRKLGREFLERHGPRVKITAERLERVEGLFERHGGKTILIGRFIGLVRALAPFVAGASRLPYRRFLPFSVIGTGLWAALFSLLGYIFYRSFAQVADIAGRATLAFAFVVGAIAGGVYAYRRLRHHEERRRLAAWLERQGRRPLLRPIAAVVDPLWNRVLLPLVRAAAPRLRFLWHRLTPGELGIELTTALATTAVGLYVFALYADLLADDPGTTPADTELLDLSADLRMDVLVDGAKVVTDLGSLDVVGAIVLATAIVLAVRRRPIELVALLAGFLAIYASVSLAKAGIDRPRPPGPLIATSKSGFPSGHAAYSTVYVAVAVTAARVVPGFVRDAALLGGAVILAAAIGLSRVYLHVHYWSDVAAGWSLGFGIFGACATIGLIVAHLRQNEDRPRAPDGPLRQRGAAGGDR